MFNWFWFWLARTAATSRLACFTGSWRTAEAKYSLLTQRRSSTALPPLLTRQQKVVDRLPVLSADAYAGRNQRNDHSACCGVSDGAGSAEHISVSLHQPEEVQKLVERSHAEAVIRWNAQTVAARLRVLADDMLYHRFPALSDG